VRWIAKKKGPLVPTASEPTKMDNLTKLTRKQKDLVKKLYVKCSMAIPTLTKVILYIYGFPCFERNIPKKK
jgi:hypothetical protein